MKIEELSAPTPLNHIDWRVQSISAKGYCIILGYKDARYDMKVLDEVAGPLNWTKEYAVINDNLFCGVSILCKETGQWVTKWDVGTESNTEKEKGQASDAFKRACFNWGIGRDLYDLPFIQLKLKPNEFNEQTKKPTWDFRLKEWTWTREDGKLVGRDEGGETRYIEGEKFNAPRGDGGKTPTKKTAAKVEHVAEATQLQNIRTLAEKLGATDSQLRTKVRQFGAGKEQLSDLSKEEAAKMIGDMTAALEKQK